MVLSHQTLDSRSLYSLSRTLGGAQKGRCFPFDTDGASQVHNDPECHSSAYSCSRSVSLFFPVEAELKLNRYNVTYNGQSIELPHVVHDVEVERISQYTLVTLQHGFTLAWDGSTSSVYIKMSPEYVGRTCGLCGSFNADVHDDLKTSYDLFTHDTAIFGNSWMEMVPHEHSCPSMPANYPSPCLTQNYETRQKVQEMCLLLLETPFKECHDLVSPFPFMASCSNDLCIAGLDNQVLCQALTEYARACAHAEHPLYDWRAAIPMCAVECDDKFIYRECITCCPVSCNTDKMCIDSKLQCLDGCYCPEDLIYDNGSCVKASECPCEYHGMLYSPGQEVQDKCNSCTCMGGSWNCTEYSCPGECSVTGDIHFDTFDGRVYTFQATCQYILAKSRSTGKFTISLQNAPCGANLDGACIQSVNIIVDEDPMKQITVNNIGEVYVSNLYRITPPYSDAVFQIHELSSMFLQVKTEDGLRLQYNWKELRLYLEVDESWKEDTVGLCGTFNGNIQDDFLSPAGMIESTPQLFGNSWKLSSACVPGHSIPQLDPCDIHQQAASYASEMCEILNTELFAPCHEYLSPAPFYQQCKSDTCKCGETCLCAALAHYARQCRKHGVIIDFRAHVSECAAQCQETMEYGTCISSCNNNCRSLSLSEACDTKCPPGQFYFKCSGSLDSSSVSKGVACERTCESHLLNLTCSGHGHCVSGCICPPGFLKHGDECFEPIACPCLWKGKEYYPGDKVTSPCHNCVCQHGSFQCIFHPCPSMCTAYGDRHYRTFDGLLFDYIGACKVYLVKSNIDLTMSVTAENVDCYESGVICRKSLSINIGRSFIVFDNDSGKPNPSSLIDKRQPVFIWQAGYYTIVHIPTEDVTVLWDRKTTIHIQVGPRWQGKLTGLCGNFDLKTVNEMRSPENIESATPQEFGNSWTAAECVNSPDIRNPCSMNPLREPFAKRECGILLSEVFEACHPVVDVTWFYMNCLTDTCGCNRGGDCECFCTSVSAYAHRCCQQGITVDWRSPTVCPYDCEFYNKVLGKGPFRLVTYLEGETVLAANFSGGAAFPVQGAISIPGVAMLFMLTPGLCRSKPHDTTLVSLESAERPNYFLHLGPSGYLCLTKWEESDQFQEASTFIIHKDTWLAGYDSFESYMKPGFFVHYMLSSIHLMKYNHSGGFRQATLFKLEGIKPAVAVEPITPQSTVSTPGAVTSPSVNATVSLGSTLSTTAAQTTTETQRTSPTPTSSTEASTVMTISPKPLGPTIQTTLGNDTTESLFTTITTRAPNVTKPEGAVTSPAVSNLTSVTESLATTAKTPATSTSIPISTSELQTTPSSPYTTRTTTESTTVSSAAGAFLQTTTTKPPDTFKVTTISVVPETELLPTVDWTSSAIELPSKDTTVLTSTSPRPLEETEKTTVSTAEVTRLPAYTTTSKRPTKQPGTSRVTETSSATVAPTTVYIDTSTKVADKTVSPLTTKPLTSESTVYSSPVKTVKTSAYTTTETKSPLTTEAITSKSPGYSPPVETGKTTLTTVETTPQLPTELTTSIIPVYSPPVETGKTTLTSAETTPQLPTEMTTSKSPGYSPPVETGRTTLTTVETTPQLPTELTTSKSPGYSPPVETGKTTLTTVAKPQLPTELTTSKSPGYSPPVETRKTTYATMKTKPPLFTESTTSKSTAYVSPLETVKTTAQEIKTPLTTKPVTSESTIYVSPFETEETTASTTHLTVSESLAASTVSAGPTVSLGTTAYPSAYTQTTVGHMTEKTISSFPTKLTTTTKTTAYPKTERVKTTSASAVPLAFTETGRTTPEVPPMTVASTETSSSTHQAGVETTKTTTSESTKETTAETVASTSAELTKTTLTTLHTVDKVDTNITTLGTTTLYPFLTELSKITLEPTKSETTVPVMPYSMASEKVWTTITPITSSDVSKSVTSSTTPTYPSSTEHTTETTTMGYIFSTKPVTHQSTTPLLTSEEFVSTVATVSSLPQLTTSKTTSLYQTLPDGTSIITGYPTEKTSTAEHSAKPATPYPDTAAETVQSSSITSHTSSTTLVESSTTSLQTVTSQTTFASEPTTTATTRSVFSTIKSTAGTTPGKESKHTPFSSGTTKAEAPVLLSTTAQLLGLTLPTSKVTTSSETLPVQTPETSTLSSLTTSQLKTEVTNATAVTGKEGVSTVPPKQEVSTTLLSASSESQAATPAVTLRTTGTSQVTPETVGTVTTTSPTPKPTLGTTLHTTTLSTSSTETPKEKWTTTGKTPTEEPQYSEIIDECTKYVCMNGQLMLFNKSQNCPYNATPPNCGLLGFAILVNGDKCCPQWDCPCRCSVFPDLNIITFDGNSVAIYKAASYIVTQLPNETVSIQVQECQSSDTLLWNFTNLCLVALNITHKAHQVLIDRLQRRKNGFEILDTGNMYLIKTPAGLKIQWFHSTGMMVIETDSPSHKLTTMGLCGCCDGDPTNDLTLFNGTTVSESEDPTVFIDSWQVPNTTSFMGQNRRREVNCSTSDCSECLSMLSNQTFSSCHAFVPPKMFCEVWVRDAEYVKSPCTALAAYVAACHKFSVCIEWRSPDYCSFMCPPELRYQACLPACNAKTCPNHESDSDLEECSGLTEGCVCPEGTLLHRPYSALCIPSEKCACTDSFGTPHASGEVWKASKDGCCMYKCDNDSIIPVEHNCTKVPEPVCSKAGEVTVSLADDKSCCPQKACVCNQTLCDQYAPECKYGEKLVSYYRDYSCCPDYICECDPDRCESDIPTCRDDQTLIATRTEGSCCMAYICMCGSCSDTIPTCQEGEVFTVDANSTDRCCPPYHCVCETYRCTEYTCPLGMSVVTVWSPDLCCPLNTCECACDTIPKPQCKLGEMLQIDNEFLTDPENQCDCSKYKCVKEPVCVDGEWGVMRPGQTLVEHTAEGICYTTQCTSHTDPVTSFYKVQVSKTNCTAQCEPIGGTVISYMDGCCKTCKEDGKSCQKVTVRMTIRKNDCRSNRPDSACSVSSEREVGGSATFPEQSKGCL
ncbi:Otogelin [Acipenser ruthenus]|uniref:Otogelin n=1 Tax=Acipenser ruthenus TaxID=7906 RepID=A0A444U9B7_ACIRT|nr:Otogelin [Acipenser ruthenus]